MIATQDSQPKPGFGLPWSVAAIIAGVGSLVLVASVVLSSKSPESNLSGLEKETEKLQAQLVKAEAEVSAAKDSSKGPQAEL